MIKTRKVKVIGRLFAENAEYRVIRMEKLGGDFASNITGFTVVPGFATSIDGKIVYAAPIFLVSTSWTLEYHEPVEIDVEDDLEDEEVNDIDIDIPDMTEDEWEHNLNRIDKENLNENSQA